MLDGDLVLGPFIRTYYSLFQKVISNIPTLTPSLFNQTRKLTRHNVSVTRYQSVIKKKKTAMTGRQLEYLKYANIFVRSAKASLIFFSTKSISVIG